MDCVEIFPARFAVAGPGQLAAVEAAVDSKAFTNANIAALADAQACGPRSVRCQAGAYFLQRCEETR
jgi:hypothetical protein